MRRSAPVFMLVILLSTCAAHTAGLTASAAHGRYNTRTVSDIQGNSTSSHRSDMERGLKNRHISPHTERGITTYGAMMTITSLPLLRALIPSIGMLLIVITNRQGRPYSGMSDVGAWDRPGQLLRNLREVIQLKTLH